MCQQTCNNRGFTLVELLVTVGLIGILAAVMVSYSQGGGTKRQMDATSQAVLSAIAAARSHSLANSQRSCMSVDGGAITAFVDSNGDGRYNVGEKLLYRFPTDPTQTLTTKLPGFSITTDRLRSQLSDPQTATFDGRGYFIYRSTGDEARDTNFCLKDSVSASSLNVYLSRLGWSGITLNAGCVAP